MTSKSGHIGFQMEEVAYALSLIILFVAINFTILRQSSILVKIFLPVLSIMYVLFIYVTPMFLSEKLKGDISRVMPMFYIFMSIVQIILIIALLVK